MDEQLHEILGKTAAPCNGFLIGSLRAHSTSKGGPMRKRAVLILLLALAAGSEVRGQVNDSEMVLGGVLLRLGMSQNEALAALGPVYDLMELDGTTSWFVSRRGSSSPGDVGRVSFWDRRLTSVDKNWGPRSDTAEQVVESLYDALRSVGRGDWQTCQVHSGGLVGATDPDWADLRIIRIHCGGHEIRITGGRNYTSEVSESIGDI